MADIHFKASSRIDLNVALLSIAIAAFFFIIAVKAELLFQKILVIQLVLAIPFLLTSTLAYSKISYGKDTRRWNSFGWFTFIVGYAFILNTVGILIGNVISVGVSLIFFASSWILTAFYSFVDISLTKKAIPERIIKGVFFILLQFFFGVLVIL